MSSVKGRFGTAAFKLRPFVCPKTLHNDDDDDDDCNDAFQKLTLLIKSGSQSGGELSAFSWKVKRKLPISQLYTPLQNIFLSDVEVSLWQARKIFHGISEALSAVDMMDMIWI